MQATVGREDGDWFDKLCELKGLDPIDPLTATELEPGMVLFTATGDPKPIERVKHLVRQTKIEFTGDQWPEYMLNETSISLVAIRRSEQ